ncbi:MAG: trehalose-phosphatase [Deltaproteobacteria bacterium]|nr:trehalose-phosphatase [Deltaproteobacteria bacterium]
MNRRRWPAYLFGKTALSDLTDFIDRSTLFAFDLDGTLAPITADPAAIGIPDAVRRAFADLNERAPVAVITGRSRLDALTHLGVAPRYLIGNHGVEGLPGWASRENDFIRTVREWQKQLDLLLPLNSREGIKIENKGATLSMHYRHALHTSAALASILLAVERLLPKPRRISGKFVENLLPEGAPDKGVALCLLMQQEGFTKAFFAGDDETDEQVFRLDHENIFTLRVGKSPGTEASFYLRGQNEVARLLRKINAVCGRFQDAPRR